MHAKQCLHCLSMRSLLTLLPSFHDRDQRDRQRVHSERAEFIFYASYESQLYDCCDRMSDVINPYSPMLDANTWTRTVATKRLSLPPPSACPPESPVKPIFFQLSDMEAWAPIARVPASAEIPMAIPLIRHVNPQQTPAARWQKAVNCE